ncbi:hypothetical protein, partial [Nitrosomonas sp.]|uniref:hypothetical protein n=1 Tax=Nitrosomonas sp. TaxID=42353 RepID=UPI0035B2D35E
GEHELRLINGRFVGVKSYRGYIDRFSLNKISRTLAESKFCDLVYLFSILNKFNEFLQRVHINSTILLI